MNHTPWNKDPVIKQPGWLMESDHFSQKGLCLSMSISLDPRHEDPQDDPVDLDVQHFRDLLRQKKMQRRERAGHGTPFKVRVDGWWVNPRAAYWETRKQHILRRCQGSNMDETCWVDSLCKLQVFYRMQMARWWVIWCSHFWHMNIKLKPSLKQKDPPICFSAETSIV